MLKTSRHIVEATKICLERMTTYVKSSSERKQIGDFVFPHEKVPKHVKEQESYKNIRTLFDDLSEAIKDALSRKKEEDNNQLEQRKLEAKVKEDLQVETEKQGGRKNQLQPQQEVNHKNEPNVQTKDTQKSEDRKFLKETPEIIKERGNETAEESVITQADKVEELMKQKLENPKIIKERGNETGVETVITQADKVEELPEVIVKEKLENPEEIKERGNETVKESVITQADKVEELPEVIVKEKFKIPEVIKVRGNETVNESVISQADKVEELPEVEVKEKLEEETQNRTERSNQELHRELNETKRLLQERTEELHIVEDRLLQQRAEEMEKVKQRLVNGIPEEYGKTQADATQNLTNDLEGKSRTHSLENSRSLRTKTWVVEHTLNEDQSRILKERMSQLYNATCKDLESDICKLLDILQYNEVKKHSIFRGNVASKMKIINQFLSEGNEAVDAEYKSLISLLEEERARLQTILNSVWQEGRYVQGTLKKIEDTMENTKELEGEVHKFQGNSRDDKKFLDLEHKLLNNVMKLDVIQTMGHDEIRKKKLEANEYALSCLEQLDANVKQVA